LEGNEPGLVGYWNFDADDGHTVMDRSRYGNHGTLLHRPEDYYDRRGWATKPRIGGVAGSLRDNEPRSAGAGPELTGGISGNAYYFDGHDDMIEIPESDSLDISGKQITVSAWIKARNIDSRQVIAAKNALGINSWILEINPIDFSEGHINFYLDLWGIDGNFASKTPVTADTWYHVAGVYNGHERKIYINGRLDAGQIVTREIPTNDQPVTIGGWGSPSRYFDGTIDEVALFNTALLDYEIKQLYENAGGLTDDAHGLVGYWNFDADDGDTVLDRSRYGNHGRLKKGNPQSSDAPSDLHSTPLIRM
jgi:hypothetical protein